MLTDALPNLLVCKNPSPEYDVIASICSEEESEGQDQGSLGSINITTASNKMIVEVLDLSDVKNSSSSN